MDMHDVQAVGRAGADLEVAADDVVVHEEVAHRENVLGAEVAGQQVGAAAAVGVAAPLITVYRTLARVTGPLNASIPISPRQVND